MIVPSARLHVLLAKQSPQAVIIRRGPSKEVASIGWNRTDDTFVVGQWLKGKIYHFRSDISPDGKHWIYFAMGSKGRTWTAVAQTPYLKALDFFPQQDAWNGGGLFTTNTSYWLNESMLTKDEDRRHSSGFTTLEKWQNQPNRQGECPGIYFLRLERDRWEKQAKEKLSKDESLIRFNKSINNWQLWKLFHAGINYPIGKSPYYESHMLLNTISGEKIMLEAEWADLDLDRNRLLWAENGKIMAGKITKNGISDQACLFDTNALHFAELKAPY